MLARARLVSLVAPLLLLAGCSGGGGGRTPAPAIQAPSSLVYSVNPATYTVGVAVAPNVPTSGGGAVASYSVSPTLPAGLALNTTSGVISGTPTTVATATVCTVTASNSGGSTTAGLAITVQVAPPSGLTYGTNPAIYTVGVAISPNAPGSGGGAVSSYAVSPALPTGLALNTTTGTISGTPTVAVARAIYTVTATNATGSATIGLPITVNPAPVIPPSGLTYGTNPASYTVGTTIAPNTPSSGGGAVAYYAISPSLPVGLGLEPSTGVISGTPTTIAVINIYTVTAYNAGGSTSAFVSVEVKPVVVVPPVATSIVASTISPAYGGGFTLTPTFSGGVGVVNNGVGVVTSGVATNAITANWVGASTYTLTVTNALQATAATSTVVTPQTVVVAAITPANPTVTYGTTKVFSSFVTGAANTGITWSASAGTMNASTGVWTADMALPAPVVTASSYTGVANTQVSQGTTDGLVASAKFYNPSGVAADPSGNLYVADLSNNKIRKITPAGVVSTYAGTGSSGAADGPAASATFSSPSGVAVDSSGNVYVADSYNSKIRKITTAGVVSTYAGNGGWGSSDGAALNASLGCPSSVAVDSLGNLYVADTYNLKIRMITPGAGGVGGIVYSYTGTANTQMGSGAKDGPAASATFGSPGGVAVDAFGNLYVADSAGHKIRMITPGAPGSGVGGTVSSYTGTPNTDLRYVNSLGSGAADGPAASATFSSPAGVAVASSGNLYVADSNNNKIRQITPGTGGVGGVVSSYTGAPNTKMDTGATDGAAAGAKFSRLQEVTVDASGNIYIADAGNQKIRKITTSQPVPVVTITATSAADASRNATTTAHVVIP